MLSKLWTIFVAVACCMLTACQANQAEGPRQETGQHALSPSLEQTVRVVIPWGPAEHQLGLNQAKFQVRST
jgi:hypothetical protein